MPTHPNTRSKYWCFTLNNPTRDELSLLADAGRDLSLGRYTITYMVCGREEGASGTPHVQGYLELSQRVRLSSLTKLLRGRIHWESRRGTAKEASDYCKKDGTYRCFGEISKPDQGSRTDLDAIRQEIKDGASPLEIAESHFSQWCIYRRSFGEYRRLLNAPRARPRIRVFVLWGRPGTGKTRYVYHRAPAVFPVPTTDLSWFDGYCGQADVLFDDYRGEGSGSFLLRLLDIYPLQVPVKGGFVAWTPERIWITSNLPPPFELTAIADPLLRRIHADYFLEEPLDFDDPTALAALDNVFTD